jgi:hypothetical protein
MDKSDFAKRLANKLIEQLKAGTAPLAAFGVGPLQSRVRLEFNTIYGGTAIFALMMAALSFVLERQAAPLP